jgi:hypothetical protein
LLVPNFDTEGKKLRARLAARTAKVEIIQKAFLGKTDFEKHPPCPPRWRCSFPGIVISVLPDVQY